MADGICPFADWRATKNHGYGGRTGQNKPLIITSHIMGGYKRTMDNTAWLDSSGISSHFGIGPGENNISQYVNILNASYANGITGYPAGKDRIDRTNRHIAAIEKEPGARWQQVTVGGLPYWNLVGDVGGGIIGSLYNCRSVTIEHEGVNQTTPWDEGMIRSTIRVQQWIIEESARLGMPLTVDADLLVGHFQLDPIHRPYCPGPAWPKARILAALQGGGNVNPQEELELADRRAASLVIKEIGMAQGDDYLYTPVSVAQSDDGKMLLIEFWTRDRKQPSEPVPRLWVRKP